MLVMSGSRSFLDLRISIRQRQEVSHPLHFLKLKQEILLCPSIPFNSRMMSDSISSPKYPTWASAARSIWREGGVKAVYRGFVPCILRAFPTVSNHSITLIAPGCKG